MGAIVAAAGQATKLAILALRGLVRMEEQATRHVRDVTVLTLGKLKLSATLVVLPVPTGETQTKAASGALVLITGVVTRARRAL